MDDTNEALMGELNRIRLDEDRSYQDLADAIGIDAGALYKLLNGGTDNPWDRTIYKIRKYLAARETPAPARRKAARA